MENSRAVRGALAEIGDNLATMRRLLDIPSSVLAARAGISTRTLSRIEAGEPGVALASVLEVARALTLLPRVVDATDPLTTDLGRARVDQAIPRRVR